MEMTTELEQLNARLSELGRTFRTETTRKENDWIAIRNNLQSIVDRLNDELSAYAAVGQHNDDNVEMTIILSDAAREITQAANLMDPEDQINVGDRIRELREHQVKYSIEVWEGDEWVEYGVWSEPEPAKREYERRRLMGYKVAYSERPLNV